MPYQRPDLIDVMEIKNIILSHFHTSKYYKLVRVMPEMLLKLRKSLYNIICNYVIVISRA